VEDSPHGTAAAAAAGLPVIAVPNELTVHLDLSAAGAVVSDPPSLPLGEALARARDAGSRPAPAAAIEAEAERHLNWARWAATEDPEPWHYLTSRMLQTVLAVTRHDDPEAVTFPRAAVLLAALAFWDIAVALDASEMERIPVPPVLALLGRDDEARAAARIMPVREQTGEPALLAADRDLLGGILADPGEWEATRTRACRLIARASELRLGAGTGAPRLALLSVHDWGKVARDAIDHPARPLHVPAPRP